MKIISVKESPEYTEKAIKYISSKWDVDEKIYRDCISHCIDTPNPLPQWYILVNENQIIGCAGLVTNDFISRMDLYPWLCALFIEEEYRGNFYSQLLIEKAQEDTRKGGFQKLYLSTKHIGLYEKLDFNYIANGFHLGGEQSRIYELRL